MGAIQVAAGGIEVGGLRVLGCRVAGSAMVVLLPVLILAGCGSGPADDYGPAPAGFYRIRSGDTLSEIAQRHKVGYKALARWNHLSSPYRIYAGRLLRVEPPRRKTSSTGRGGGRKAKTATRSTAGGAARAGNAGRRAVSRLRWQWPLAGKVVQGFRPGDRTRQGVRITGRPGQQVVAAEGGRVVYSDSGLRGYGNLVIVKHADGYLSAYGFNRRLLVAEDARVKRGQAIAEVGQASDGAYLLHFEVRRNGAPVDPLKYLP